MANKELPMIYLARHGETDWSLTGQHTDAIKNSTAYDATISGKLAKRESSEALFFDLALEDLTRAADLFRPIYDETNGVD